MNISLVDKLPYRSSSFFSFLNLDAAWINWNLLHLATIRPSPFPTSVTLLSTQVLLNEFATVFFPFWAPLRLFFFLEGIFKLKKFYLYLIYSRSRCSRDLRRRSAAARLLRLWVRIPPGAWMSVVSVVCCQVEASATG